MKDEKKLDAILERFYNSYNKYNTKVLEELGNVIKQFDGLNPSQAHKLGQELKYSNNIDELLNELSRLSGKSIQDIDTLLDKVAEENVAFAEAYGEVKSYKDNIRLQRYVDTIKKETNNTFKNLSKTKGIGFTLIENNNVVFKPLKQVYRDVIDEAVFNVSTGVVDYQSAMRSTIRQLADSGIKVHEAKTSYLSGYNRRIDSSVRQAVLTGVRKVNLGVQERVGKEFGANGYEISAHFLCADDHLDIQGRQFSKKEYERLNDDLDRPIGELNCKHFAFAIILGVNLPSYTDKQLKEYRNYSQEKIKYNGKTYTRYEASQVQRRMETEIRKQKDRQIIAKASGNSEGILKAQQKITQLTKEYSNFSNKAGLKVYKDRLTVSGYKRIKVNDTIIKKDKFSINISKNEQLDRINYRKEYLKERIEYSQTRLKEIPKDSTRLWDTSMKKHHENELKKYNKELKEINNKTIVDKTITLNSKENCIELLKEVNVDLQEKNIDKIDLDVLKENTLHYYNTIKKYPFYEKTLQENDFKLSFDNLPGGTIGQAERSGRKIELDISDFSNKNDIIYWVEYQTKANYNMPCSKDNYINYFATHELGHNFNYRIIDNIEIEKTKDLMAKEFTQKTNEYFMENIYKIAERNTGKSRQELANLLSDYGKSNVNECIAELFANANCGKPNELGKAFDEYFKELLK